jgi:hypothetical protein
MAPRGHSVRHNKENYVVYCFANPASAEQFRAHFDDEPFDPKDCAGNEWNKP